MKKTLAEPFGVVTRNGDASETLTPTGEIIMEDIEALLARVAAMPHTHAVVTRFADGAERRFTTRNLPSANNYAFGERRKIGKMLINRETGAMVRVVSVTVEAI